MYSVCYKSCSTSLDDFKLASVFLLYGFQTVVQYSRFECTIAMFCQVIVAGIFWS